jgi:predicted amidohydrolase
MNICVVQTRSVKGDIARNIVRHKECVDRAASDGANIIMFPELSITGYEPVLAQELATVADDPRFDDFQEIADTRDITIGIGAPTKHDAGIYISTVVFRPHAARDTYSKTYIHADEESFFVSGRSSIGMIGPASDIALAICYELSIPDHSAAAFKNGAKMYIASVAKTAAGVEKAITTLSEIAAKYSMMVLMSNCAGPCHDFEAAGKTSVWNNKGVLLGQLNDTAEGFLIFDTGTQKLVKHDYL